MHSLFQKLLTSGFLSRYPIIPGEAKEQAIRIRRLFMAVGTYAMIFLLGYFGAWLGLVEYQHLNYLLIAIVSVQFVFYAVLRSSLNLRLSDPSMTEMQMYAATLFLMYMMYFAYNVSSVYMVVYLMVFVFGIFILDTRKFLRITAFSLATYGLTICLLYQFKAQGISFKVELLKWMALAVLLTCFSFIGGYISTIRQNLRKSHRKLEEAMATIREMAIRDDLTGLLNRRRLMELLEAEIKRAVRSGHLFSLIMMDIDCFKKINDTYGHSVGDAVIKEVAAITLDTLRTTDYCGRYGGDEFILVLTQTTREGATAYAERIRSRIAGTEHPEWGRDFHLTVSIGITEYNIREDQAKTISRADDALYRAKRSGRNRIECLLAP